MATISVVLNVNKYTYYILSLLITQHKISYNIGTVATSIFECRFLEVSWR